MPCVEQRSALGSPALDYSPIDSSPSARIARRKESRFLLGLDELPTTDEDELGEEPALANCRVLGSIVHFNGEPEAIEVPKSRSLGANASLVSFGAGFGSKSAAMYQIKFQVCVEGARVPTPSLFPVNESVCG